MRHPQSENLHLMLGSQNTKISYYAFMLLSMI